MPSNRYDGLLTFILRACILYACAIVCGCHDGHHPSTPVGRTSDVALPDLTFIEPSQAAGTDQDHHGPSHLVVLVHGLGDTPQNFSMQLTDLMAEVPARFILPQGVIADGNGWGWFTLTRPLETPPPAMLRQMRSSTKQLAALIRAQRNNHPNAKVIVVGFSQGGLLSFALALHEPELVDAVFPIAGWLPKALVPPPSELGKRPYPSIRALHGMVDSSVPFRPTKNLVDQLHTHGLDAHIQGYSNVEHEVAPSMINDLKKQLVQLLKN